MGDSVEVILQDVALLRDRDYSVTALAGGITNRNYRIDVGDDSYVLRIAGANTGFLGIDRNVEHACSVTAARLDVGTEVIAYLPQHGALLTRFVAGRVLTPSDFQDSEILQRAVTSLHRYHLGPPGPGAFSPFHVVRDYYARACARQVPFPPTIGKALQMLDRLEAELDAHQPPYPCHNDLLAANLIDDGLVVRIIDWEYAGMGDYWFDLGNFAANNVFDEAQEHALLDLYFGAVRAPDLRRLRLMRLVSDLRESLWGFLQAGVSTLDFTFLEYGRTHLDRFLAHGATFGHGESPVALIH